MSRGARGLVAVCLGGILLLACIAWPRLVLQTVVLPAATVLWLVLRLFVLSIDQQVYWWGTVALAVLVTIGFLLRTTPSAAPSLPSVAGSSGDPAQRWRDCLRLNVHAPPARDTFRRDLAWMLTSLYASRRPGFAKYQVREALLQRQIPLPEPVYRFLFAHTLPPEPRPPFLRSPGAWVRMTVRSAARAAGAPARRRRGPSEYRQAVAAVLDFMETELEMNHELEPDS